jgi:DNA modification methylase
MQYIALAFKDKNSSLKYPALLTGAAQKYGLEIIDDTQGERDEEVREGLAAFKAALELTGIFSLSFQKNNLTDPNDIPDELFRCYTEGRPSRFLTFLSECAPVLPRSFYIFNSDKMLFALRDGMKDSEVKFTQLLIWIKNNVVVGRMNYLPQHELIAYGWYGSHEFYKAKDKSIIYYPKPNKSPLHPTMKPVGLLRNLILNSSKIGDYVYDPFGGSGSTLIACEQTKRKCLMVELDPDYCQVIIDRFKKVSGVKAERIKQYGR